MPGFGAIEPERVLPEAELFIAACEKYPASSGHSLINVKRVVAQLQTDQDSGLILQL